MSHNIIIYTEQKKKGKIDIFPAMQTSTEETHRIIKSSDRLAAYKAFVLSRDPEYGHEHLARLDAWVAQQTTDIKIGMT